MTESELKRRAELALAELAELNQDWPQDGDYFDCNSGREFEYLCAANPALLLSILAENESLQESANHRAIQSLRADCEALRKDAEIGRIAMKFVDRMADPTDGDPLVKSVAEFLEAVESEIHGDLHS